jgi:capsular polysaccharide biosynthesis protein
MAFLDQLTPQLYAFVKRNRKIRDAVMPIWHFTANSLIHIRSFINREEVLPPPKAISESTAQWIQAAKAKDPAAKLTFKLLHPAVEIKRILPKTIEKEVHWKFRVNETRVQPATFVAVIEGGRAYDEGVVITPDNHLLAEVSRMIDAGEYVKDASKHQIFSKATLPPLQKVKGKIALLSAPGGRGYYHWMFDVLPRIHLLKEAGISLDSVDKFLVNNYVSRFHIETLNILGISREKVLESHWSPHIKAEQLIIPSLVGDTGHIPAYACEFLRQEFLSKIPHKTDSPKRLYFNRGQVTHRKVTNETEIVDFLSKYQFNSITLEALPLLEQISLMAHAEVVIVPHGAGLTNIIFCKPGTKVIELLSPHAVNVMYWTLSNQVGLDYYYLLAEGSRPPDYENAYLNNENLTININDLASLLEMAGIS